MEQRSRVFWRKTPTYVDKLSAGSVNSNRADFELDFKLPGQDSNLDKENQNLLAESCKHKSTKGLEENQHAHLAQTLARETENDPDLAPIIVAWPELPEAIRQVVSAWKDLPEAARQALVSAAQLALAVLEPSSSSAANISAFSQKRTMNSKEAP